MTTAAQAAGAGFDDYGMHFRPLESGDYSKLDVWMQDAYRKRAIETAQEARLSGQHLVAYYRAMHAETALLTTSTEAGNAQINSMAGAEKVLHLTSGGKCTPKRLREALGDVDDAEYIQVVTSLLIRVKSLTEGDVDDDCADEDAEEASSENPTNSGSQ